MDTVFVITEFDPIEIWQIVISGLALLGLIVSLYFIYKQFSGQQSQINSLSDLAKYAERKDKERKNIMMPFFKKSGSNFISSKAIAQNFVNCGNRGTNLSIENLTPTNHDISGLIKKSIFENGYLLKLGIKKINGNIESCFKFKITFEGITGEKYEQIITVENQEWSITEIET